jgi:hypothetical protein
MKTSLETIEQKTHREREIESKKHVLMLAEHTKASADAIIARLKRELMELEGQGR